MTSPKDRVLNVRITARQRGAYERAAALEGTTVTGFVTGAADERAEQVLLAHNSMRLPSDVFDSLLAMLDGPEGRLAWMEGVLADPLFTNT